MAKRALSTLKNYFKKYAYPTEQQFHDALDSFVHKDDKIGTDSLAQEVIDTFNNKAEVAALQAEVAAREQADDRLRDDLDETRGVYSTNSEGPVIYDKDGNEVLELTDSGMVQIDYPEGGHEQPAIQINGDTVKVKDTEGVVRIEVNEAGVRLKGAPNDYGSDTSEPEITLNKDNAGGVTIKGGSDTNFVLKPDRALLNSHSNGLGYKYGNPENIDDQTLQIDLGSDTIVKAVTRLENEGVVDREENVSVKTPNTVRGSHENIMQANGRRYILYHPGGTAQMLHSNPSGTDKNGNVTGKVFFLDSYHDGGNRLLEVTDEGDRTQGQIESHRVDLRCPGTGGGDGLRIERRYLPASGKETHFLDLMADGTDVLYSQIDDGPNGFDATTNVMVDGSDVVVGRCIRDSNGNDVERSVRIEAAGDHYVLQGWHTTDPNTGNEEYETSVMTDGVDILTGRKEYPTDGDRTYVTTLMNPDSDEVLRADKSESSHTTVSVSMENNGNGQLLDASHDLDDEDTHMNLMNHGNDVLSSYSRNWADRGVTLYNNGDDVIRAEVRTQNIGGTSYEQSEMRMNASGVNQILSANAIVQDTTGKVSYDVYWQNDSDDILKAHKKNGDDLYVELDNHGLPVVTHTYSDVNNTQDSVLNIQNADSSLTVLRSEYSGSPSSEDHQVTLSNAGKTHAADDDNLLLNTHRLSDIVLGRQRTLYTSQELDSATDGVFDLETVDQQGNATLYTTLITTVEMTGNMVHSNGLGIPYLEANTSMECRIVIINGNTSGAFSVDILPQVNGQNYMIEAGEAVELRLTVYRDSGSLSNTRILKAEPRRMVF